LLKRLGMLPCWKNGKNRWPHIWKSYPHRTTSDSDHIWPNLT